MTTQELRELDAWIAEHVMGWREDDAAQWVWHAERSRLVTHFAPTVIAGDAMNVLKKCAETGTTIEVFVSTVTGKWCCVREEVPEVCSSLASESETLELAICLFAKQLFSQTTK